MLRTSNHYLILLSGEPAIPVLDYLLIPNDGGDDAPERLRGKLNKLEIQYHAKEGREARFPFDK